MYTCTNHIPYTCKNTIANLPRTTVVEVTELSTNKQHSLSYDNRDFSHAAPGLTEELVHAFLGGGGREPCSKWIHIFVVNGYIYSATLYMFL